MLAVGQLRLIVSQPGKRLAYLSHGWCRDLDERSGAHLLVLAWSAQSGLNRRRTFPARAKICSVPSPVSDNFLLLRQARSEKLTIEALYDGKVRLFEVRQLGWNHASEERCLAYQFGEAEAGWRCYKVDELSDVKLGPPLKEMPAAQALPEDLRSNCVPVDDLQRVACELCRLDEVDVFFEGELVVGYWVESSAGERHARLVSKRHVRTWFEASAAEQNALTAAIQDAGDVLTDHYAPEGMEISIPCGKAAGQTVDHLYVDIFPRGRIPAW